MTWMKNFPKERNPFFLYILNTHMISEETTQEREKHLMQTLAYRTISKAAKDRQNLNGETSIADREINHYEDLCLLLRVYLTEGRLAEAAEILTDPRIGFDNYVGGHRWELVQQYMGLLDLQQRWGELHDVCIAILTQSRHQTPEGTQSDYGKLGDDWKTWQTLITANAKGDPLK